MSRVVLRGVWVVGFVLFGSNPGCDFGFDLVLILVVTLVLTWF
jgi:hypothetical protein